MTTSSGRSSPPVLTAAEDIRTSRWTWGLFLLLAVLFHILLMLPKIDWSSAPPPRVEVQQVDPRKLEAIRKQWKREQQKSFLIDKNKAPKDATEAPPDARYFSDRNIRVEKEQRAKQMDTVPTPPSRAESRPKDSARNRQARPESRKRALPSVGNLGVPLHLSEKPPAAPKTSTAAQASDQSVMERNLPEGSENLLNAQESVFYSFYYRLYEAIAPVWQSHLRQLPPPKGLQPGDYSTTVEAVFDPEGNLLEVKTLRSSGIHAFDEAVNSAWKRAPRVPNPPRGLQDEAGKVHTGWTFTVQVGQGFGMLFAPPSRDY